MDEFKVRTSVRFHNRQTDRHTIILVGRVNNCHLRNYEANNRPQHITDCSSKRTWTYRRRRSTIEYYCLPHRLLNIPFCLWTRITNVIPSTPPPSIISVVVAEDSTIFTPMYHKNSNTSCSAHIVKSPPW